MDIKKLRELLSAVDYPNIEIITDEEVADIFDHVNLQSFLKWFAGKLMPHLLETSDMKANLKIISDFGFCSTNEMDMLNKGTLGLLEQMKVVHCMLSNLKIFYQHKNEVITEPQEVSKCNELQLNVNCPIIMTNTKSTQIQLSSADKYLENIEGIEDEVRNLRGKLAEVSPVNLAACENESNASDSKLDTSLLENNSRKFIVQQFIEKVGFKPAEQVTHVHPTFGDTVETCNKALQVCVKYNKQLKEIDQIASNILLDADRCDQKSKEPERRHLSLVEILKEIEELHKML